MTSMLLCSDLVGGSVDRSPDDLNRRRNNERTYLQGHISLFHYGIGGNWQPKI